MRVEVIPNSDFPIAGDWIVLDCNQFRLDAVCVREQNPIQFYQLDRTKNIWCTNDEWNGYGFSHLIRREYPFVVGKMATCLVTGEEKMAISWVRIAEQGAKIVDLPLTFIHSYHMVRRCEFQSFHPDWITIFVPELERMDDISRGKQFLINWDSEMKEIQDPIWSGHGVTFLGSWNDSLHQKHYIVLLAAHREGTLPPYPDQQLVIASESELFNALKEQHGHITCSVIDQTDAHSSFGSFQSFENRLIYEKYRLDSDGQIADGDHEAKMIKYVLDHENPMRSIRVEQDMMFRPVMTGIIAYDDTIAVYRNEEWYVTAGLNVVAVHHYRSEEDHFEVPYIGTPFHLPHRKLVVILSTIAP